MSTQHLDLEALRELADVIDYDALPMHGLNVALQRPLKTSGMQEINGVRLGCLGLKGEVGIVLEVEINGVDANVCLAARHHLRETHRVNGQPSGTPGYDRAHAQARGAMPIHATQYLARTGAGDFGASCYWLDRKHSSWCRFIRHGVISASELR
jgi:hypothetical protein